MSERRLHHIGYVVPCLDSSIPEFQRFLRLDWDGRVFGDPLQMVRVCFLNSGVLGSLLIELVEPAGNRSPVRRFAMQGGGLHHICYEVTNLAEEIANSRKRGGTLVRFPMPATAFEGRRIAWVQGAGVILIEYLEI